MTHYEVRVDCRVPPDGSGGIDVLELCSRRCVRYVLPPPPPMCSSRCACVHSNFDGIADFYIPSDGDVREFCHNICYVKTM